REKEEDGLETSPSKAECSVWEDLTLEKARLELNENPDTLHQDIQEVRDMVITRPDIGFLRTDDAFILRFLRARKFQHFEAFRLLAQYFEYRQQNLDMFKSFKATDPGIKQALKDGFPGGLANLDHYGRKILVLSPSIIDRYTLVDILRAILLSLEAMIEDPELQVNGFVLIIDWSNFTFKGWGLGSLAGSSGAEQDGPVGQMWLAGRNLPMSDVEALYANIPHKDVLQAVRNSIPDTITANLVAELCDFVLIHSYFRFGDNLYLQIGRTAMGTHMAPQYANIFMADLEQRFLSFCPLTPT
uniref:Clavesin-2 n=1 Tax=Chelonoidis abingdonii TaxID=106734 RepID=A0A8C0IXA7_CHEAB